MRGGHRRDPFFKLACPQVFSTPAVTADQVVVVSLSVALSVERLALSGAQNIDLVVFGQRLEVAIHGCQTDLVPASGEVLKYLLCAAEVAVLAEVVENRLALLGHSLHGVPFIDEACGEISFPYPRAVVVSARSLGEASGCSAGADSSRIRCLRRK